MASSSRRRARLRALLSSDAVMISGSWLRESTGPEVEVLLLTHPASSIAAITPSSAQLVAARGIGRASLIGSVLLGRFGGPLAGRMHDDRAQSGIGRHAALRHPLGGARAVL